VGPLDKVLIESPLGRCNVNEGVLTPEHNVRPLRFNILQRFESCGRSVNLIDLSSTRQKLGDVCRLFLLPLYLFLFLLGSTSCSTLSHPLPPANLSEPGWKVRQGQAIWKLPGSQSEIAGEVIFASSPQGKTFIQFSKSPFTMVVGQCTPKRWQVEFPPQNKRYAGPGNPPKRLTWLQLARVLAGKNPPTGWTWTESEGNWRLQNPGNGETIEGFFFQ